MTGAKRISDDELAYHTQITAEVRAAQATWRSWSQHLSRKYELEDRDAISETGEIIRVPSKPGNERRNRSDRSNDKCRTRPRANI